MKLEPAAILKIILLDLSLFLNSFGIMVAKKLDILKLFSIFFSVLNFLGVSKFKAQRNLKLEIIIRCYSFIFMMIFLWLFISNHINFLYTYFDSLTNIARAIDRAAMVLMSAGICFEATFRSKRDFQIFKSFDKIDQVLLEKFGIAFEFKKIVILNVFVTIMISFPVCLLVRQIFLLKMNTFYAIIFALFVFGQITVTTVKVFHILLVAQFWIRFKAIKKLFDEKSDTFLVNKKIVFMHLFDEIFSLIDTFNDSFGFIALINIGEDYSLMDSFI